MSAEYARARPLRQPSVEAEVKISSRDNSGQMRLTGPFVGPHQ